MTKAEQMLYLQFAVHIPVMHLDSCKSKKEINDIFCQ